MPSSSHISATRREFVQGASLLGLSSALHAQEIANSPGNLDTDSSTPAPAKKSKIFTNRAPLAQNAFYPLPLGSIRPRGWLNEQLRIQATGLSGHLGETWADVGPNSGWLGGTGESWERGPYYLDGLVPLAYLVDDPILKAKAQKFLDWTLEHQAADGMFGPSSNNDWWPRIVMLKVLTQYQEFTGDDRVIPLMEKYFKYQLAQLPTRPLRDWGKFRWQDEVLSVIWLYNRTGSPFLVDLMQKLHTQGHDWVGQFVNFQYTGRYTSEYLKLEQGNGLKDLALSTHGVNNGQAIKAGPVWSLVSHQAVDRDGTRKMIEELDKYHGLPNGMFSCDEHLSGPNPSQGSELCTVVEYMFSLEQSLAITGDPALGDKLEKLAFNALPGTFTDDMWAHQYNQEPNQVECSLHHKPWVSDGPESNIFGLDPNFGCCTANYHQGWPKFTNSLFMLSEADGDTSQGLVAVAYAPCEVRTALDGTDVHIVEETDYPFRGTVKLTVHPGKALRFPLRLRIPAWAQETKISVNGASQPAVEAGTFAVMHRTWNSGDTVVIEFPMQPRVSRWFHNSLAVDRGPLVFSYPIGESWVKWRDRGMTADWKVFPSTQWNYALKLDAENSAKSFEVAEDEIGGTPFGRAHTPVTLTAKAHKVTQWNAVDGVADAPPESPVKGDEQEESIRLIPYGAAKLRITAFPEWKS
ncbi:MAG TPA: beta-L-arabinofuranosidase domain-containing protein [Terracidiphilus sp.]|nr:beta-L-arabinofuranosidase domain-containing protein [Terracidiphilus sp.]